MTKLLKKLYLMWVSYICLIPDPFSKFSIYAQYRSRILNQDITTNIPF